MVFGTKGYRFESCRAYSWFSRAAGFRVGDAEEFLGLTAAERSLVDLRVRVSPEVRRLREARQMTQQQLATELQSSQSGVAKIESASADVSLDLLLRGYFTLGGTVEDLARPSGKTA